MNPHLLTRFNLLIYNFNFLTQYQQINLTVYFPLQYHGVNTRQNENKTNPTNIRIAREAKNINCS